MESFTEQDIQKVLKHWDETGGVDIVVNDAKTGELVIDEGREVIIWQARRIADLDNTLDGQLRANDALERRVKKLESQRKRWAANILAGYRQDSDFGHEFCAFCPGDISGSEEYHDPDCIVLEARAALEEAHGDD